MNAASGNVGEFVQVDRHHGGGEFGEGVCAPFCVAFGRVEHLFPFCGLFFDAENAAAQAKKVELKMENSDIFIKLSNFDNFLANYMCIQKYLTDAKPKLT